jgi:sugar lactone lactonase YvrE
MPIALALSASLAGGPLGWSPDVSAQDLKPIRVVSEQTVKGFAFPESVAYDPQAKVLYVSEFGSALKPAEKDGQGRISKVSLTGEVLDKQFLPAPGGEALNKPKGIWVQGNRLWVTDIDVVWVFDLKTRQGRKLALPGIQFANDPAVMGNALYVSDNRADQLYRVEPADFLQTSGGPQVTRVFQGKSVNPNGLYPAKDGSLLMVGFMSAEQPRGIYSLSASGEIKVLAKDLGRLDGLYQLDDGSLLVTDWNSGSLLHWSAKGTQTLAKGFKGPADFCVVPEASGLLVVVPDLVQSELRLLRLAR